MDKRIVLSIVVILIIVLGLSHCIVDVDYFLLASKNVKYG